MVRGACVAGGYAWQVSMQGGMHDRGVMHGRGLCMARGCAW